MIPRPSLFQIPLFLAYDFTIILTHYLLYYILHGLFFYLCCSLACTRMYVLTSVATTLCNLIHGLMKRPRSSLSSTRAPQDKHVPAGNRTLAACVTGEHSSKELFEQLMLLLFGTSTASIFFQSCYMTSSPHLHEAVVALTST